MFPKIYRKLVLKFGGSRIFYFCYRILYFLKVTCLVKPGLARSLKDDLIPVKDTTTIRPVVVVPLLETNHYQHVHVLFMAKAFELRGYDVVVIVCDEYIPACEMKSYRSDNDPDPCFTCRTNRTHLLDLFRLNYLTLSQILSGILDPISHGQQMIDEYDVDRKLFNRTIEDSVTRYFYGSQTDFEESVVADVRKDHTSTAYISLALADELLKRYRPAIIFNNMFVYSAWGPVFSLLENQGVAPITIHLSAFDLNAIRLNNADLFRHKRTFNRFVLDRNDEPLDITETKILNSFIQNRKSGNDQLMKEWKFFQQIPGTELRVDKKRKNVFLFPNIPWDIGLNEFTGPFSSVIEWVEYTITHFANHDEIDLWIKPHPAEVRGPSISSKSVSQFIMTKYPVLPQNIHVIDADLGLNTYSLFQFIDCGVVLTGTLGLEMALDKIPVVSAGVNPCYGLGLLSEPATKEEYVDAIESWDNSIKRMPELMRFCYFYFIRQGFKWPLTERVWGDDLRGVSFSKVSSLAAGGIADLDSIFEEIEFLIDDFRSNSAASIAQAKTP